MHSGYMVIARDGKEYGPLDRDAIQHWYLEGKLDRNSKVFEPGGHKYRLHEMFDLALWNNPELIRAAIPSDQQEFRPKMMAELSGIEDTQPTPGMFAAGVLLIINGVMGLLIIGLIAMGQVEAFGHPRSYVVPFYDLIVATGLIRGKEKYRKWGLVRAVLGGILLFTVSLASLAPDAHRGTSTGYGVELVSISSWFELVFQLVFCFGIAALLWGDWPSKRRVVTGVVAVIVAWAGIILTDVTTAVVNEFKSRSELAKYTDSSGVFNEDRLGVSVRMPRGWTLLTKDNPVIAVPGSSMIAFHRSSGCFAALVIERDIFDGISNSQYLNLVFQNRQIKAPSMQDVFRSDAKLGEHEAFELDTLWTTSGTKFSGYNVACREGSRYYLLTGWCAEKQGSEAHDAFRSLMNAFQIEDFEQPALSEPPEITSDSDAQSYDLVFYIEGHSMQPDGVRRLVARGVHEGRPVGFELLLGGQWKASSPGSTTGAVAYGGTARYHSIGKESDEFLQALDKIYETEQSPKQMKAETTFSAISMQGDPHDNNGQPLRLKLFFEGRDDSQYAELYADLFLSKHALYLREKDSDYRNPIVRALKAR